jgi:hypothetical protein
MCQLATPIFLNLGLPIDLLVPVMKDVVLDQDWFS